MMVVIALGRAFGALNDFDVQAMQTATPESLGDRHVVAVGVAPSTPIGRELDEVLPLVLREGGSRALVEEEGTLAEILDSSRVGAIQEVEVPWAPGRALLSISGTDSIALGWAANALIEQSLVGNVALLQSRTQLNTFDLERARIGAPQPVVDRFTEEDQRLRIALSTALIGLGAVAVAVAYALRGRLRPRFLDERRRRR
jgi:hypothetical protein